MGASIDTVIIPAAGLGTRVRTLTGGGFKESLMLHGRSLIAWALHDAERSRLRRAIIVLSPAKRALAEQIGARSGTLAVEYAWQEEPLGLAHALVLAHDAAPAPVIAYLPDNVALSGEPICAQLLASERRFPGFVLGLLALSQAELALFGSAGFIEHEPIDDDHVRITRIHDKRTPAPTTARVLKGFPASILPEAFFTRARELIAVRREGEVDDTPILQEVARAGQAIGRILRARVFDCGRPEGYAAALRAAP